LEEHWQCHIANHITLELNRSSIVHLLSTCSDRSRPVTNSVASANLGTRDVIACKPTRGSSDHPGVPHCADYSNDTNCTNSSNATSYTNCADSTNYASWADGSNCTSWACLLFAKFQGLHHLVR
jgi:hypothetical protein